MEYKGYTIEIDQYQDVFDSPLDWQQPEERGKDSTGVYFALIRRGYNLPYEISESTDEHDNWTELAKAVTKKGGELAGYKYKFVTWYEHSATVINLRDDESGRDWDTGIAGVVFAKTDDDISSEFAAYKQYVEGDIWAYSITDQHGDIIDTLGNIYGYDDAVAESKSFIDSYTPPRDASYAKKAQALHA